MWIDGVKPAAVNAMILAAQSLAKHQAELPAGDRLLSVEELGAEFKKISRLDNARQAQERIEAAVSEPPVENPGPGRKGPFSIRAVRTAVSKIWEPLAGREECNNECFRYAPELAKRLHARGFPVSLRHTVDHHSIRLGEAMSLSLLI
jgi:hypothetical protein